MAAIPKKVEDRIKSQLRKFQKLLTEAQSKDINESDTVTLLVDILSDVCGWDKYTDVTSEYAVRNTYCDIAVKYDDSPVMLIEAKAVGIALKSNHMTQAVHYASDSGIEWVVLTNGLQWQVYKIVFTKPVKHELFCEFNFLEISSRNKSGLNSLYILSKEGVPKRAIKNLYEESQATNKYMMASILLSDQILDDIRREIRRMNRNIKIESEAIGRILKEEVLKREVTEGESFAEAQRKVRRAAKQRATG